MAVADIVHRLVAPILDDLGLELYDLEHVGGILRITIDKPGGVDLEVIALVTRLVGRELDQADPLPGHYTLEVSSPGLERPLRTPEHFRRAVGRDVNVRTHAHVEGPRRAQGILRAVDDDGITMFVAEGPDIGERRLAYGDIERARTVFSWGGAEKPGGTRSGTKRKAGAS